MTDYFLGKSSAPVGNEVDKNPEHPVLGRAINAFSREVHEHDDVDFESRSHHHTIGVGPNQVPSGADFQELKSVVGSITAGGGTGFVQEQTFATPIAFWIMAHPKHTKGLGVYVENGFGIPLEGDISYPDLDHVRVDFYFAQTGLMRIFN